VRALEEHLYGDGVTAIEWAERLPPDMRDGARLRFDVDENDGRTVTLVSDDQRLTAAARM
jgi:tRNA A37 threonylcarbamoyladenosine biosynthesis protein TsaE